MDHCNSHNHRKIKRIKPFSTKLAKIKRLFSKNIKSRTINTCNLTSKKLESQKAAINDLTADTATINSLNLNVLNGEDISKKCEPDFFQNDTGICLLYTSPSPRDRS